MRTKLMTLAPDTLNHVLVVVDTAQAAAVDEEGARGAVCTEDVQKSRSEHVGTVIEGQRYCSRDAASVDDCSERDGGADG